jgi:thymidylate synthase (FAD)
MNMKIVQASFEIEPINGRAPDGIAILKEIERAGRTCYKSEWKITEDSYLAFAKKLIASGHYSVLDHRFMTVRFITDRGVTHELVRHRLCAFSQESTRYCNYSNDQFGKEITVIDPRNHMDETMYGFWKTAMKMCESLYLSLAGIHCPPQIARSVLPNSLKTEIVTTADLTEWRHIFKLRTSKKAHPQMRELMVPLLAEFKKIIPVIFDDIKVEE